MPSPSLQLPTLPQAISLKWLPRQTGGWKNSGHHCAEYTDTHPSFGPSSAVTSAKVPAMMRSAPFFDVIEATARNLMPQVSSNSRVCLLKASQMSGMRSAMPSTLIQRKFIAPRCLMASVSVRPPSRESSRETGRGGRTGVP